MKRIFMLSSYPLFCEGVATLLDGKDGMEFVGRESDAERAIEQIKALRPDVVIVDTGNVACNANTTVMRILQERVGVKIIGLNLLNNTICVFHEEHRPIRNVEDLMSAIETDDNPQMNQKGG